jgi:hypothetical protein
MATTSNLSADAKRYYADGFRKTVGGVPVKVFSKKLRDGRYVRNPNWQPRDS